MSVTYVISLNSDVQIAGTVTLVTKFCTVGTKYLWVRSVKSASCHLSGACSMK